MLGHQSKHASECYEGQFIGVDWEGMDFDLSESLPETWQDFNKKFIPIFLEHNPNRSKRSAGRACGALHTICKGINVGDTVFCPNGKGAYFVGAVIENYSYVPGGILPHRRIVEWHSEKIERSSMTKRLQSSTGAAGTVVNISDYEDEIKNLLGVSEPAEDTSVFAFEKHLEDFLVRNWSQTELGRNYDILTEDGEIVGKQFATETGLIDILAISKDKKEYLVIELKQGATDKAVGQLQRYMGDIMEELAEKDQKVRGVIVAADADLRLLRALKSTINIEFYKYQVNFKLSKVY